MSWIYTHPLAFLAYSAAFVAFVTNASVWLLVRLKCPNAAARFAAFGAFCIQKVHMASEVIADPAKWARVKNAVEVTSKAISILPVPSEVQNAFGKVENAVENVKNPTPAPRPTVTLPVIVLMIIGLAFIGCSGDMPTIKDARDMSATVDPVLVLAYTEDQIACKADMDCVMKVRAKWRIPIQVIQWLRGAIGEQPAPFVDSQAPK